MYQLFSSDATMYKNSNFVLVKWKHKKRRSKVKYFIKKEEIFSSTAQNDPFCPIPKKVKTDALNLTVNTEIFHC